MMKKTASYSYRTESGQHGFTLLETLLSIGILAGVLSVGSYIVSQYTRLIINEKAASQMLVVQNAGEEYVRANFTQLLDTGVSNNIAAIGAVRNLSVADLIASNYLGNNFSDINSMHLRMLLYIRNSTNTSIIGALPTIEVMTVTMPENAGETGQPYQWLADTAQFGKGRLGILSNSGGAYNNITFRSTSNQWAFPVSSITGYAPPLPVSADDPSGYIAAYGIISVEDIFDDNVLYRIPIAGQPGLNRMETDLNMNNHKLAGVGTMTVDNLQAGGMTLNRTGGYALSTDNTLTLASDANITGDMTVYADNNPASNDFRAANASLPSGTASADIVSSPRLAVSNTMVSANVTTNSALSRDLVVNNGMTMNNVSMTTSNLQLGSGGSTGNTITTGTLNTPRMATGSTRVNNTYQATTGGSHLVAGNMRISNAAGGNVTIRTMAAQEVQFGNLCYIGGAQDDVEQCP